MSIESTLIAGRYIEIAIYMGIEYSGTFDSSILNVFTFTATIIIYVNILGSSTVYAGFDIVEFLMSAAQTQWMLSNCMWCFLCSMLVQSLANLWLLLTALCHVSFSYIRNVCQFLRFPPIRAISLLLVLWPTHQCYSCATCHKKCWVGYDGWALHDYQA